MMMTLFFVSPIVSETSHTPNIKFGSGNGEIYEK
jgi:hypothetical protein